MTTNDVDAVVVRFHKTLYTDAAIREAAATFADFATFAVRSDGEHHVVEVRDVTRDVDGDVVAEFCNFALANSARSVRSSDA